MKDLEFWEEWLTTHGYSMDFDEDGLWAESWIQEHKWIDVFELMVRYSSEVFIEANKDDLEELAVGYAESNAAYQGYWQGVRDAYSLLKPRVRPGGVRATENKIS